MKSIFEILGYLFTALIVIAVMGQPWGTNEEIIWKVFVVTFSLMFAVFVGGGKAKRRIEKAQKEHLLNAGLSKDKVEELLGTDNLNEKQAGINLAKYFLLKHKGNK